MITKSSHCTCAITYMHLNTNVQANETVHAVMSAMLNHMILLKLRLVESRRKDTKMDNFVMPTDKTNKSWLTQLEIRDGSLHSIWLSQMCIPQPYFVPIWVEQTKPMVGTYHVQELLASWCLRTIRPLPHQLNE